MGSTVNPAPASRVLVELRDGSRFSTAWNNRALASDAPPLGQLFTGQLVARVLGQEDCIEHHEIARVTEEVTLSPEGNDLPRILIQTVPKKVTPAGRKLIDGVATFVDSSAILSPKKIDRIIDQAKKVWDGWNGAKVHSDGAFQVVVKSQPDGSDCVIHVSKEGESKAEVPGDLVEDRRRISGKKTDLRRSVPHTVEDFLERLKEYGFEIASTTRHYSATHPDKPGIKQIIPTSPSDHRWADNLVSQVKNTLGIDVRQPLDKV